MILRDGEGRIWLQRRPPTGIWAGMHCVPVFADLESRGIFVSALGSDGQYAQQELQPFVHVLTHRDLHLHPLLIQTDGMVPPVEGGEWLGPDQWSLVGLPAPIRKLLDTTQSSLW